MLNTQVKRNTSQLSANRRLLSVTIALMMCVSPPVVLAVDTVITAPGSTTYDPTVDTSVNRVNASVNMAERSLNDTLNKIGSALNDNVKNQNDMMGGLTKAQLQAQRDLMVQQEVARAQQRAVEIYGEQGTDTTCNTEKLGAGISEGRAAMAKTAAGAGSAMEKRSRSGSGTKGTAQQVKDLLDVPEDQIKMDDIYPKNLVLNEDQKKLVASINERIIDPFPPIKIIPSSANGTKYEAMRLTYEKTKTAPRKAENTIFAMKSADFPVNDWAKGAWKDMGKSGTPDGVDPSTGKMSYDSFIALFVRSRIDNPEYYKDTNDRKDDSWQLRQINMNTVMLMEIQNRQLQLIEHLVELQAQQRANEIDSEYGRQLNDLLRRSESSATGASGQ